MTLPTGNHYGSLPDKIIIKGDHWVCIMTEKKGIDTFDTLENQTTKEKKTVERKILLKYLYDI